MRKSVVSFFLIAPFFLIALFFSSLPAGAAPLHVRAATAISASVGAGDPVCSLDGSIARRQARATPSWSNALADSRTLKLFRADDRFVAQSKDKVTARLLLPPELTSADPRWSSADASDRENANANAAVNHLFAPPNGMSLFVTQTNNDRPSGASEPNATLAAVQLLIH